MANITPTPVPVRGFGDNANVVTWTPLTSTDTTGLSIEAPGMADRSVQFSGTWGTATAVLEGSNDGTTWFPLTDPQGNAISKTADALEMIEELTRYIRPKLTGGNGSTSLSCIVLMKRVR